MGGSVSGLISLLVLLLIYNVDAADPCTDNNDFTVVMKDADMQWGGNVIYVKTQGPYTDRNHAIHLFFRENGGNSAGKFLMNIAAGYTTFADTCSNNPEVFGDTSQLTPGYLESTDEMTWKFERIGVSDTGVYTFRTSVDDKVIKEYTLFDPADIRDLFENENICAVEGWRDSWGTVPATVSFVSDDMLSREYCIVPKPSPPSFTHGPLNDRDKDTVIIDTEDRLDVKLTCRFKCDSAQVSVHWEAVGNTNTPSLEKDAERTDQISTDDGVTDGYKSVLTITKWPYNVYEEKQEIKCVLYAVSDTLFNTPLASSDSGYIFTSSNWAGVNEDYYCGEAGEELKMKCMGAKEYQKPDPTVQWYKVGSNDPITDSGEVELFSEYVEIGMGSYDASLTIKSLKAADIGSYYCVYIYTLFEMQTENTVLSVIEFADMPAQFKFIGDTDVVFSTTFSGAVTRSIDWQDDSDTSLNTITSKFTVDEDNTDGTLSMTILTVEGGLKEPFKIEVTFDYEVTHCRLKTRVADLYILTAVIETTQATLVSDTTYYINSGDMLELTCTFSNPGSLLTAPTITWTALKTDGVTPITIESGERDDTVANNSPDGVSKIAFVSAATSDQAGTYTCTIDYGSEIGTTSSETFTIKVLGVEGGDTVYVPATTEGSLSCSLTGSDGSFVWTFVDDSCVPPCVDLTNLIVTGSFTDGKKTSTLTFPSVAVANEGLYSCAISWTGISGNDKSLSPTLRVLGIKALELDPTTPLNVGDTLTLKCERRWPDYTTTPVTATWTMTDTTGTSNPVTNAGSDQLVLEMAGLALTSMGSYTCELDWDGTKVTEDTDVLVRGKPTLSAEIAAPTATNFVAPATVLAGHAVTLTCTFYGDDVEQLIWVKNDITIVGDGSKYTGSGNPVTDTAYGATATLIVNSVSDGSNAGSYDCTAMYTTQQTNAESDAVMLIVLGGVVMSATEDSQYAEVGADVTITCTYLEGTGVTAVPVWTVPGVSNPTAKTQTVTESTYEITGVAQDGSRNIDCTVTYTNGITDSATFKQYVRSNPEWIVPSYGKVYAKLGEKVTLTCVMYGDALKDDKLLWYSDNGRILDGDGKVIVNDGYDADAFSTTSTLEFLAVTRADVSAQESPLMYWCKSYYAEYLHTQSRAHVVSAGIILLEVTVADVDTPRGETGSISCDSGDSTMVDTYSWSKGGQVIPDETDATLELSTVTFAETDTYTCTVTYLHGFGELSDDGGLVVQGVMSLEQVSMAGSYNEVGETITLKSVIRAVAKPDDASAFILKDSSDTEVFLDNLPDTVLVAASTTDYESMLKFTAVKVDAANKQATFSLAMLSTTAATVTIEIYEKCTLPAVDLITALSAGELDHKETLTDLTCDDDKSLYGPSGVSCDDGVVSYNTPSSSDPPECVDLAVDSQPIPQLLATGVTATLSCVTKPTPLTISTVKWYVTPDGGSAALEETDSSPVKTGTSGAWVFTSEYEVVGAEGVDRNSYHCVMETGDGKTVTSELAIVHIVGIKSIEADHAGAFFENEEAGSVKAMIYEGPGIASVTAKMVKDSDLGTDNPVSFTAGAQEGIQFPYTYTVANGLKETGVYTITVTYNAVAGANGEVARSDTFSLPVYQFCDPANLAAVIGGTWSPVAKSKVDFNGYATLACTDDGTYSAGQTELRCVSREFEDPSPVPTCQSNDTLAIALGVYFGIVVLLVIVIVLIVLFRKKGGENSSSV